MGQSSWSQEGKNVKVVKCGFEYKNMIILFVKKFSEIPDIASSVGCILTLVRC